MYPLQQVKKPKHKQPRNGTYQRLMLQVLIILIIQDSNSVNSRRMHTGPSFLSGVEMVSPPHFIYKPQFSVFRVNSQIP